MDYSNDSGLQSTDDRYKLEQPLAAAPQTYEFAVQLPKEESARAGVLLGNYNGGSGMFINIEIYTNGQPRVWYKINNTAYYHLFTTDVRSAAVTHLALTVEDKTVNLYVNGELKETATLRVAMPVTLSDYFIGADNRADNTQPFKGTIYGVNLFDHVRTPEQIAVDALLVSPNEAGLIVSHYFRNETLTVPA